MSRLVTLKSDPGAVAEGLRSCLAELAHAETSFFDDPAAFAEEPGTSRNHHQRHQREAEQSGWSASSLEHKLERVSSLRVDEAMTGAGRINSDIPGLAYATVDALVRFVGWLMRLVDDPVARGDGGDEGPSKRQSTTSSELKVNSLVDSTLLCLANLLESPPWRHIFFRVLHKVQLEQEADSSKASQASQGRPSAATLQECLWRKIVADTLVDGNKKGTTNSAGGIAAAGSSHPSCFLVSPVNHAAVRLCCNMVRHCPLSFPASSYASLGPHLADYLLASGGIVGERGDSPAVDSGERREADLTVMLDLFAACARGSPHFRQFVKGLRQKRDLYRRLLGFLGPKFSGGVVVRALCALTRVLAGDVLEGKIFERGNALETASLVTGHLLDISGRIGYVTGSSAAYSSYPPCGTLGEQRRYADVASDLARSRVFTPVLIESGGLSSFLREAVTVLCKAAADVPGHLPANAGGSLESVESSGASPWRSGGKSSDVLNGPGGGSGEKRRGFMANPPSQELTRPEPLLRALCSFCLEHSPARSIFVQALLGGTDTRVSTKNPTGIAAIAAYPTAATDPCAALFVLCLHPHQATAAAASTLLQCLLVGGGALGAVSGPSLGAAAGVGVIPAGYYYPAGGSVGAAGSGHEEPLQAALLEKIGVVVIGDRRSTRQKRGGGKTGVGKHRNRSSGSTGGKERKRGGRNGKTGRSNATVSAAVVDMFGETGGGGDNGSLLREGNNVIEGGGQEGSSVEAESSSGLSNSEESDDEDGSGPPWFVYAGPKSPTTTGRPTATNGLSSSGPQSLPATAPALSLLIGRLQHIGADLASAQEKDRLGISTAVSSAMPSCARGGSRSGGEGGGGGILTARSVETEQEATSLLCLLSALALASPETARSLAQALPLESTLAPILAAQRAALSGTDPADYPRAPVEIVLVSLTLIAQLGVTLTDNDVGACGGSGGGGGLAQRRHYGGKNVDCKVGYSSNINDTSLDDEEEDGKRGRKERRRRRRDAAGATRLRKFLGEQVATGEVKLCIGHAACRAESKDLARRVASLISLLQAGGGADALLVADALYAFAQSAEARESGLRSRALAAEGVSHRERVAGGRHASALEEAEGLVSQIEARNAEELQRRSEEEIRALRRLEDAHGRALTRLELSLRRSEESAADLEKVLRSKEDALRCAGRETRAKDLEIASLRGDLAGEQRLRAAAEGKLDEAYSERDELAHGKSDAEEFLESTKSELYKALEEGRESSSGWDEERASASKGWAAAREAEEGLERSNARAEEAYGKLILLAKGYKTVEDQSHRKAAEADATLVEEASKTKMAREQAREEERRHRTTKAALRDGEASLQRAEERLLKVSTEAAESQAVASAVRAAGREAMEKVASSARETAMMRKEVSSMRAELERARATCAEKDLDLASKSKELGQQAGIIDYINKLSSNAAETTATSAVVAAQAVAIHDGDA